MARSFSLRRMVRVLVTPAAEEVHRVTEDPDPAWPAWASAHGFTYEFDGSAHEGGRLFAPVPDRHGMGEQCYGVVQGVWRGHPFTIVRQKRWRVGGRQGRPPAFSTALVLRLPGSPVPALLAMTPAAAFAAAGGELPSHGTFEWRPPDLLVGVGGWGPANLEGALEQLTLQLAAAPPEVWQRQP